MSEIAPRCAPFEEDLSALLDRELAAPRAQEVRAHLETCPDCARRFAALRRVDGSLQRVAASPVDAARTERLRSSLHVRMRAQALPAAARRAPPRRRRWLAPLALVATAAAAGALLLIQRPPTPAVPPASEGAIAAAQAPIKTRADAELAARELSAKIEKPIGASVPDAGEVAATRVAAPVRLEDASDEELELAGALRDLPALDAPGDLEVVEQLDLVESLDALDAQPAGRG